ncbi:hypothetical protein ACJRO7_027268 [Eucalyptus globulus]|uniref:Serine carboxypeptidase-like 18 n=1 Tax=Eucalyptus globulus TaxID=34317 RepID=A0ABD3JT66_EUCGL
MKLRALCGPPLCLFLCLLFQSGLSQTVVKSLPGLPGDLPFHLETGYIGAGELDDVQLFYYFVESGRSPRDDPLVLWLTGGPGCSALSGLIYEIGPFTFNYEKSSRFRPALKLNDYSWTKVANIIFLDQPVGTGFSYANNWESYNIDDNISVAESYEFLRKWLKLHPQFLSNPLYIAGDSYSGVIVPRVALEVDKGNEVGLEPKMNLEGYVLGNPLTSYDSDLNSRVPFAHLKGLISNELYESAKTDCNSEYINVNESNADCVDDLKVVNLCVENIRTANILEPNCVPQSPKSTVSDRWDPTLINRDPSPLLLPTERASRVWCREYNYLYSYIWASDRAVQDALHIREW